MAAEVEPAVAQLVDLGGGRFLLEGELNLRTVAELARKPNPLFIRRRRKLLCQWATLELNLAGVTQSTSVGLALMLEWLAQAQSAGSRLTIINWPEPMTRIARFSNIAGLLALN